MSAHIERARLLIQTGRFADAEREAGLSLVEDPDDAHAHALMAICKTNLDKLDEAVEHATQAMLLAPDEAYVHYVLSTVSVQRGELEKAEREIRAAIQLDPVDADYHHLLGTIFLRRKQWPQALDAADEALRHDPEHTDSHNLRAVVLMSTGRGREALWQLGEALRTSPDDALTHGNVGASLMELGMYAEAQRYYEEALRIDPELEWAREGLAEALKVRHPLYDYLSTCFMLGRFARANGWFFALAALAGYVFARRVALQPTASRMDAMVGLGVCLAILCVCWFAAELANFLLQFHRVSRRVLSLQEKITSWWIGGCAVLVIASIRPWRSGGGFGYFEVMMFFQLIAVPLDATTTTRRGRVRRMMWLYTATVAACGVCVTCLNFQLQQDAVEISMGSLLLAIRWITMVVFVLGCLLSVSMAKRILPRWMDE